MTNRPRTERTAPRSTAAGPDSPPVALKRLAAAVAALASLLLCGPAAAGSGAAASPAVSASALADWSRSLWSSASEGRSGQAIDLLERAPELVGGTGADGLVEAVDRYKTNLSRREAERNQRIETLRGELASHEEAGEVLKGLKSAIEWHTLATDKRCVMEDAGLARLVQRAEADAREAESRGEWLNAHALYNHLNVLFDEPRVYEQDLRRLGQRLMMLRLYAPDRLHEMRSEQRMAQGDEPLPPFNRVGEDWREKLAGVQDFILKQSLGRVPVDHVDRVGLDRLLIGGYSAVRTMIQTPDLAGAFPGVADEAARNAMIAHIDGRIAALRDRPETATSREMILGFNALQELNARTTRIAREALVHEFTNGAFAELDEFSSVIWPDELSQFERTTEGSFKGVGIQITLNEALDLKVVTPLEGTPAARAGIRAGDIIRRVDGDSTLGMSLTQAVDRITGPAGSKVTLSIERQGVEDLIEYELTRQEIPIYSVKGWLRTGARETDWDWFIDRHNGIGYVRISQFTNKTTQELRAAVGQMRRERLRGLILDLRGNPGGLLSEAVGVASLFINQGVVVTQESGEGRERERQSVVPGPRIGDLPVVVLINGGSASASEIVAGALQDYRKAVVVGERSFGKGSVQNVFMLGPAAALKLTTQYYRLPGRDGQPGRLIHKRPGQSAWGVEPDVQVEVLPKQFGEAFQLRQEADIIDFDEAGNVIPRPDRPDPTRLITEGLDPQLETALLLIQSQVIPAVVGARAELTK